MVVQMPAEEHDRSVGVTSHLPHAAAAVLATMVPETLFRLAGSGFSTPRGLPPAIRSCGCKFFRKTATICLTALEAYETKLNALANASRQGDNGPKWKDSSQLQKTIAMLWEVDIYPAQGHPDLTAQRVAAEAADLGLPRNLAVTAGSRLPDPRRLDRTRAMRDRPTNCWPIAWWNGRCRPSSATPQLAVAAAGPDAMLDSRAAEARRDGPVAQSALAAIADFGLRAEAVRTLKKYWVGRLRDARLELLCSKVLANDAIEQVIVGPLDFRAAGIRLALRLRLVTVPIRDDGRRRPGAAQPRGSALSVAGRDADDPGPFSHAGPRSDRRRTGNRRPDLERALQPQDAGRANPLPRRKRRAAFRNMLKETIFAATQEIRRQAGERRLVRQRLSRQRRRHPLRRRNTTSSSRSRRTTIPRPWSLTAAPTRASAA